MLNFRALERLRPWPVYLMAAALPVSMAATSLSKLLIVVVALPLIALALARQQPLALLYRFRSVAVILLMLGILGLSISYSDAPWPEALGDWGKYAKLTVLPLILVLLRNRRDCTIALATMLVAQSFVLLTSCLLSAGWLLPWVPKNRNALATVYSSYLDQAIMTAGFAAICWHLRHRFPGRLGAWLASGLALAAVVNVIFLLPGRSGQVAMLAVVALAVWWALPARWRLLFLAAPLVLGSIAALTPSEFRERMGMVVSETRAYNQNDDKTTSTGIRLNFWHRSLQAIAERPLTGFGVGSWSRQFLRLDGAHSSLGQSPRSNPHQEYLQWGVQLGVGGMALVVALMFFLARDAQGFSPATRQAAQSVAAVFAVACLFNSSLFDALIGDYFCATLGILLAYGACESGAAAAVPTAPAAPAAALTPLSAPA